MTPAGPAYVYRAEAKRILDGDTAVLSIDVGFEVFAAVHVRIRRVNAPELANRPAGEASRDFLTALLLPTSGPIPLLVQSFGRSFERWVADVWCVDGGEWVLVSDLIIASGHGSPYPY